MNKSNLSSWFIFLTTSLFLVGCGGGGSSGGPSTSSKTGTSFLSSSPSSLPTTTLLTIKGTAVANGLIGGEVNVVVGTQSFKTSVNNQGQYQLTLDVANIATDQPFTAIATGAASNQWVQLAALYPSLSKLVALAGADGVLDATEYLDVNISPMTTAEYSLVMGKKLSFNNDTERNYALLQITAVEQFDRAALMQRMLSAIKPDLSSKYKTTLDMFLDYEYSRGKAGVLHLHDVLYRNEEVKLLADPLQIHVANKPLVGKFVLSAWGFNYLLDFNENGTGLIRPSSMPSGTNLATNPESYGNSSLTWERKGNELKVTFDEPIQYEDVQNLYQCADDDCVIRMNSMLISLIADSGVGVYVDVVFNETLTNSDGEVTVLSNEPYRAALLDRSYFYKLSREELVGYEWYTDGFSYVFQANGTAVQINQQNKIETSITWQLNDGVLTMDGGILALWPIYPDGPGYTAMQLLAPRANSGFTDSVLKPAPFWRHEAVNMTESDWVGRWNRIFNYSLDSTVDYYSNLEFRDGFEKQALQSWSVISNSHVRGYSEGSWRTEYELLAIQDGRHYMQYCYGLPSGNFVPHCRLEAYVIDKTFTGTTFWDTRSYTLFDESGSLRSWQFNGGTLERDGIAPSNYWRVSANMVYLSNYRNVLEILSSTRDSIEVCEYEAFSNCENGTIYNLRRGIEIKFKLSGKGYISDFRDNEVFFKTGDRFLSPRGRSHTLRLFPSSGYQISADNISGCEGSLVDSNYIVNERDSDCELTVNFTPIP